MASPILRYGPSGPPAEIQPAQLLTLGLRAHKHGNGGDYESPMVAARIVNPTDLVGAQVVLAAPGAPPDGYVWRLNAHLTLPLLIDSEVPSGLVYLSDTGGNPLESDQGAHAVIVGDVSGDAQVVALHSQSAVVNPALPQTVEAWWQGDSVGSLAMPPITDVFAAWDLSAWYSLEVSP